MCTVLYSIHLVAQSVHVYTYRLRFFLRLGLCRICCPYGARIVAPIICTGVGLALFQATAFSCNTFDSPNENVGYGFWGWYNDYYEECDDYGDVWDVDAPTKFGRAIGILGALLGWVTFITLLVASCVRFPGPKIFFRILGSCMFVMAIFALLLLVGLASEPNEMGGPAYCVIPGALFWIAAGVTTMFFMQERDFPVVVSAAAVHAEPVPVKHVAPQPAQPKITKEVEERINDDGSKTVITTTRTTNPDGTVMEEITEEEFPAA